MTGEVLWVASETKLAALRMPDTLPITSISFSDENEIEALDIDVRSGKAILATEKNLHAYSREGNPLWSASASSMGLEEIETVRVDPRDSRIWISGENKAVIADINGHYLSAAPITGEVKRFGMAPNVIQPTLSLVRPPVDGITNNAFDPVVLQYGAECWGQPCLAPAGYYERFTLSATLNAQPIGATFVFDPASKQTQYFPATRLPECANYFQAQVHDRYGHASNGINTYFTVDTIPPAFTALSPVTGSEFFNAKVTVQGSVDDPSAQVVLENYAYWNGTGANPSPSNFSYGLTLKPGLNAITVSATDQAGNVGTRNISLTYTPVTINITEPLNGAAIAANTVLVSGSVVGPQDISVQVNGVLARVISGKFYAEVPLLAGQNVIIVAATTPAGETFEQSLSVTGLGSPAVDLQVSPITGLAPLAVTFTAVPKADATVAKMEIDFSGDGIFDHTGTQTLIRYTYTVPGMYQAVVRITDGSGAVYSYKQLIVVDTPQSLDGVLRNTFNGMLANLRAGRIDAALSAVTGSVYEKYKAIFSALQPNLPSIVDQLGTLQSSAIGSDMAEYVLVRNTANGPQAFLIYFLLGEDGVWRIDGM